MATKRSGNGSRNGRHRRHMLILLAATLGLLVWLIYGMVVDLRSTPVSYRVTTIAPVNPYLCPGDQLRYEVQLDVVNVPVVLSIVESWCQAGADGVCATSKNTVAQQPILTERHVDTIAGRTVPETPFFRAGHEYEFWHATTAGGVTTGYIVRPIIIRDNCEVPEEVPSAD